MSEESTELALYKLPSAPAELEAAFISDDYVDRLIESIRAKSKSVVGDLNTVKGRKVYISLAASIRSSKVAIDEAGKNLVAEMKKRPALVDASRRKIREALDELAIEVRKPVTDWEAEQDRIKAEQQMLDWHTEALADNEAWDKARAERIESDHEIALLLNEKFDRDAAAAKEEAERQRIAHEQEIARQAEERVRLEAEAAQRREREEAARREAELLAKANQAERDRIDAQERAEREASEAKELADRQAQAAREKAEREKQEAIAAERRRVEQAEAARLVEEKRIADEAAARAADKEHRKSVNNQALADLIAEGVPADFAVTCIKAIAMNRVTAMSIIY